MNQEAFDQELDQDAGDLAASTTDGGQGIESSLGDGTVAKATKVNLDDLPEFRGYKATMERKLADQRKQQEALTAREREWQSRFDELERKFVEKLPQPERAEWERSKLTQERDQWRTGYAQVIEHLNRVSQVEELSSRYGVPQAELLEAAEPIQAFERIAASQKQRIDEMTAQMAKLQRQLQARDAADDEIVDLGAGSSGGGNSLQKQYDTAAKRGDVSVMDRVILEAARRNVKIDRFSVFK